MTLHVEFSPQASARLSEAARTRGVDPAELLENLVTEHLPPTVPASLEPAPEDRTLALFEQWEREDAKRSAEQIAADDRLWQEFESGINASRKAQGMRQL